MTTISAAAGPPIAGLSADEWDRVQRLAAAHSLPAQPLAQLITSARSEARNRRRRLSDSRLVEAINSLASSR